MPRTPLNRRTFLKSSGIAIGLPFLEAMIPKGLRASQEARTSPRRILLIARPLGLYAPNFFPETTGLDYTPSRYLKLLEGRRSEFTVFSGVSHRYGAGHYAEIALMTGVSPELVRPNEIHNSISLDQEAASVLGNQTRFASLVLGGGSAAWNRRGVRIPPEYRTSSVFRQLFLKGTPEEESRELRRLSEGMSILDDVRDQVGSLNTRLSYNDRARLDLYLTAIREAEVKLKQAESWSLTPKPSVPLKWPTAELSGPQLVERSRQWYDLVHLAFQTDSTRVVSLYLSSQERPEIEGVQIGHHDASHHGQEPTKLQQLALIEEAEIRVLGEFLDKMKASQEDGRSLLDHTSVLYASNLGNSSSHDNNNLPILLAGGGYKHQGHLAFNREKNTPLSNLFVRMLQQTGVEIDKFGSSTGVLSEV